MAAREDGAATINPLNGKPYSREYFTIREQRKKLPAWQYLDQLGKLMRENQVIVVEGETGSGKTTQVRLHRTMQRSAADLG